MFAFAKELFINAENAVFMSILYLKQKQLIWSILPHIDITVIYFTVSVILRHLEIIPLAHI